ncbi:MAG: DUF2634 domain-containing protein [Patescibacteria group bacterium]|nr:DUF2634 domain-containing protein [Patescibacteria group bacterium]
MPTPEPPEGLQLLGAEGVPTPEAELAEALQEAVPVAPETTTLASAALGSSWAFDFEAGRFVESAGRPQRVYSENALAMWCLMALHTARGACRVFADDFGMDEPDRLIGVPNPRSLLALWALDAEEALLVHDRITEVQGLSEAVYEPATQSVLIPAFTVVLDNQQQVSVRDTRVSLAGGRP